MTHGVATAAEKRKAIIRLAKRGLLYREIAERLGIPATTVRGIASLAVLRGELPRRVYREHPRAAN